jgi:hypothetical protein
VADEFLAVYDHGMTGIISTLKPGYYIGIFGKEIHDFTFSFITPLSSDNYYISHGLTPFLK